MDTQNDFYEDAYGDATDILHNTFMHVLQLRDRLKDDDVRCIVDAGIEWYRLRTMTALLSFLNEHDEEIALRVEELSVLVTEGSKVSNKYFKDMLKLLMNTSVTA
jgi:hypothetical protein